MRKVALLLTILAIVISVTDSFSQTIIWQEDFTYPNGTTVGAGNRWTIDETGGNPGLANYEFSVQGNQMEATRTTGEVVWETEVIDISSGSNVGIVIDVNDISLPQDTDYIRAFYKLDGGSEIQFGEQSGRVQTATQFIIAGLVGNDLEIIIRTSTTRWFLFGFIRIDPGYTFDNVLVQDIPDLYSIGSGNWNDPNNWSSSRTGSSAGIIPNSLTDVFIQNGDVIQMNITPEHYNITVESGGEISWTAGGGDLTLLSNSTLTIESGGNLNVNNQANLIIPGNANIVHNAVGNPLLISTLDIPGTSNTLNISGSGEIIVDTDIGFNGTSFNISNAGNLSTTNVVRVGFLDLNNRITNAANGVFNVSGTFDPNVSLSAESVGNTVNYNGGNQTLVSPVSTYHNLSISGTGTKTAGSALSVNGNLTISSSLDGANNDIVLNGDFINSGVFTPGTSIFTFAGTDQQITSNGSTFSSVVFSTSGTKTLTDAMTASGSISIDPNVTVELNDQDLSVAGDLTKDDLAFFNAGNGTLTMNGAGQNITGTFSFSNLTIAAGSTTTYQGGNSQLSGTLIVDGQFDPNGSGSDEFRLISDASGTARIGISTGTFTGTLVAERYLTDDMKRWNHLTFPLSGVTVADIQNEVQVSGNFTGSDNGVGVVPANANPSIYYYNPVSTGLDDGWVAFPNVDNTEVFDPDKGIAIWIREVITQPNVTMDFTGTPRTGNLDIPVSIDGSEAWNLIPNPYYSNIDWSQVNKNGIVQGNSASVWDGDQYIVVPNNPGALISMGQGIWVQVTGNGNISFEENDKSSGTTPLLRTSNPDFFELELTDGIDSDIAYFSFGQESSNAFDINDLGKLQNWIFNVSSYSSDGKELSINSLNYGSCFEEVQINISNISEGNYSFNFNNLAQIQNTVQLFLQDDFTDQVINIKEVPAYEFQVTSDENSYGNQRFSLVYENELIESIEAYSSSGCGDLNKSIYVTNAQKGTTYQLFDYNDSLVEEIIATESILTFDFYLSNYGDFNYIIKGNRPGCGNDSIQESINVEAKEPPLPPESNQYVICEGDDFIINLPEQAGIVEYRWYSELESEVPVHISNIGSYALSQIESETDLFVSVYNESGCVSERAQISLKVNPKPILSVTNNMIYTCAGEEVSVSFESNTSSGEISFVDESNTPVNANMVNENEYSFSFDQTTTLNALMVSQDGCISEQVRIDIIINTIETPRINFEDGILISSVTTNLEWFKDGEKIESANTHKLEVNEPGEYYVRHFNQECESYSDVFIVESDFITSLEESFNNHNVSFYPNPVSTHLSISSNEQKAKKISIVDLKGYVIYKDVLKGELRINTTNWLPGAYIVLIYSENKVEKEKIIKH